MNLIKNITIKSILSVLTIFCIISCNSDDDYAEINDGETGKIQLKFENGFDNLGPIVLNQTTQTSSNHQKHKFSTLKYIISNIVLIDEKGEEFRYHYNNPDKGAFIVNQENAIANVVYIDLDEIPQNKYTKIRFGLGINPDSYLLGHDGQAIFWDKAKTEGMTWSWATGYIFAKLEGFYGENSIENPFQNHTGNMGDALANGTANLYREITLNLPTTARVTNQIKPAIHILANLNQFLSGENQLILDESNQNAMGSSEHLQKVSDNLAKMFRVDHVHND